jgi:hypothetical protein
MVVDFLDTISSRGASGLSKSTLMMVLAFYIASADEWQPSIPSPTPTFMAVSHASTRLTIA